jgi:kinesin family protein 15
MNHSPLCLLDNLHRGDEAGVGLVHRSLRDIFDKIAHSRADEMSYEDGENYDITNRTTTFKGSFFEIFNERVFDLLSSESLEKSLAVREDKNGVYVEGLKEVEVKTTHDAENLLAKGLSNRHVASTNMNRTSSRSHAVFVLSVKTEHTTLDGLRKVRNSKFTLVDLAGSERQKSTGEFATGKMGLCGISVCSIDLYSSSHYHIFHYYSLSNYWK